MKNKQFARIIAAIIAIILIIGSCSMFRYARTSDPLSDPIFNKLLNNKKLNDGSRLYERGDNYELYIKERENYFLTRTIIYSDSGDIIFEIGEVPFMTKIYKYKEGFLEISLIIRSDSYKSLFYNTSTGMINRNWYWPGYNEKSGNSIILSYEDEARCIIDCRDNRRVLVDLFDINRYCYEIDVNLPANFVDFAFDGRDNLMITYEDIEGELLTKELTKEYCSKEHYSNLTKFECRLKNDSNVNFNDNIFYEIEYGMNYAQVKNIIGNEGEIVYKYSDAESIMYGYLSEEFEVYMAFEFDKLIDISRYSRNLSN